MFREKLHNDLDGISPDEELLTKVTKMMQEEAAKPRQPKHIAIIRYAGMAAAVCMIAVGSLALYGENGIKTDNNIETAEETAQELACADETPETFLLTDGEDGDEPVAFSVGDDVTVQNMEAKSLLPLPEYKNKGIYENTIMTSAVRGSAASYDEIINGRNNEIDSFYRIRITGVVDGAEAVNYRGYNEATDEFSGFYNAVIEYDYLAQQECETEIVLRISGDGAFGMSEGCPPYAEGDVIAAVLQNNVENEDFRRRFSYAFHYDVYEIGGISYGAVRTQSVPEAEKGLTDYFGGEVVEYETTTPSNPAVYYGLYEIEGLADNLRELFE
ncbi:MAG: hypothetical protein IJ385_03565 [Ruminiclostridium sp.]|nr:hypothetical protein [Ruminiclostridium sp.]